MFTKNSTQYMSMCVVLLDIAMLINYGQVFNSIADYLQCIVAESLESTHQQQNKPPFHLTSTTAGNAVCDAALILTIHHLLHAMSGLANIVCYCYYKHTVACLLLLLHMRYFCCVWSCAVTYLHSSCKGNVAIAAILPIHS